MLTIHHLGRSQSERVLFLCEELGVEYKLIHHARDPATQRAPQSLTSLPSNGLGSAPFIQDGDLTLGESSAIVEYIMTKYNPSRKLGLRPDDPNYTHYLYWLHSANSTLQPVLSGSFLLSGLPENNSTKSLFQGAHHKTIAHVDKRLAEAEYLAGPEFTAADVMSFFSLTTMRFFAPFSFEPYPNIARYLQTVGKREGYRRAMEKGDPGMPLLLDARGPTKGLLG